MYNHYTFTSLTRISDLEDKEFTVSVLPKKDWSSGDYVVAKVTSPSMVLKTELTNGRMVESMKGDLLIGSLGTRFATIEATGSWEAMGDDGKMHLLTGAGLFGKLTSQSVFIPKVVELEYKGHVQRGGQKLNMQDFTSIFPFKKFTKPVIMMVGTSMSAGKTTAARIVTRLFKEAGLNVTGAKLTGAGRYRDILTVRDAGADAVFDFVDVGLPSTVCPKEVFQPALKNLLSMIEATDADVAVIEIGASPLEPYNGDVAIDQIKDNVKCTILCASDPYAVYGVMKSFELKPDVVSGIATNTLAGTCLIEKLCEVTAFNIIDPEHLPRLREIVFRKMGIKMTN